MPRQARLDAPGTLHHVIVKGIEKHRIVDDKVDRDNFVLRMGQVIWGTSWTKWTFVHHSTVAKLRKIKIYGISE